MDEDEKPVTAKDITIDVPNDKEDEFRALLKKHKRAWSRKMGEINVTRMRIDLVPDAKTFNYSP